MKTPIKQLIEQIDNTIDNNNMIGSIIYPTVESALLEIKQRAEKLLDQEKLITAQNRRFMIDFVKWITENYSFTELIIPYEVVDEFEKQKNINL